MPLRERYDFETGSSVWVERGLEIEAPARDGAGVTSTAEMKRLVQVCGEGRQPVVPRQSERCTEF